MVHKVYVNNSDDEYIIDDEGLKLFEKYNWYSVFGEYPYLITKIQKGEKRISLRFHIEIMRDEILNYIANDLSTKVIIDHIDGNVRNNVKANLRVRTQSENNMNKKIQSNNTSGIVGVSWHSRDKVWSVHINIDGERKFLGNFYYLRNAVKARVKAEDR